MKGTAVKGTALVRRVLNGTALLALLVVAGFIANTAPTESVEQAAMPVTGSIGDTLTGRNLVVTVDSALVAKTPRAANGSWLADSTGTWLVVDITARCGDEVCSLGSSNLIVGDTTWSATERATGFTLAGQRLDSGINRSGSLLFEVPTDLFESSGGRTARLEFASQVDTRLDSVLVFELDLIDLETVDEVEIERPTLVGAP